MKKIAIILPYLKAGGTERQAYYIANHLKAIYDVTVVTIEDTGAFKDVYKNIKTHCLNIEFHKKKTFQMMTELTRYLKKANFDLVISRAWNSNALTAMACLLLKKPYILFLSGATNAKVNYMKLMIQRYLLSRSQLIFSVSEKAKLNCVNSYGLQVDKIVVVQNGVDIDLVESQSRSKVDDKLFIEHVHGKFVIAFLGRLVYRKGLDILLKALSSIKEKREDIKDMKLIIIGTGELEQNYLKMIEELNIKEWVIFLGEQKNPFGYLSRGDVFAFPSRSEGFPNALLEAMALGIPPISADCPTGPSEVIKNLVNGILIEPNNSEPLERAIVELYENPHLRSAISMSAASTIHQNHNLKSKLREIEKAISDLKI